ncbi:hypothetical protein [Bradyrhizobium sp. SZCCHNS3052]|uniref:hypothetical protein n=1 Tax=Bradyrhizobium sp. SZCCHNS3052 TaxID=3057321 RepID=UPI0029163639|nr:hypothetical protein [Bradyrhizobium sp. SZCCHNS3052]
MSYERLYATLGAWLWKALDGRRRDQELREWYDILRRCSATVAEKNPAYGERFKAFYDLLDMSIATSAVSDAGKILSRQHVINVLKILQKAGGAPVEKATIAQELGLGAENLSRVLHMMGNARLLERTTYGKKAFFAITREGRRALANSKGVTPPPIELGQTKGEQDLANLILRMVTDRIAKVQSSQDGLTASSTPSGHHFRTPSMPIGKRPIKRWYKRPYCGYQIVGQSEKKVDTQQNVTVETSSQQKSPPFTLHTSYSYGENHV